MPSVAQGGCICTPFHPCDSGGFFICMVMEAPNFVIEPEIHCLSCDICEISCYKRAIMDLINAWDDTVGWKDIIIGGCICATRSDHSDALWTFIIKDVDFEEYTIYLSDLSVAS